VLARLPRAITVAHVQAIEIRLNWRWIPVMVLTTYLLAQNVLPAWFPLWGSGTTWLISALVVLAGELALLLHELSHAFVARGHGQHVSRIVFHGFQAETIAGVGLHAPAHEALIALSGPGMNIALAGLTQAVRFGFATQGPLDVALLLLVLGNMATAAMSLLPIGGSDGGRALGALRRSRSSGCL